jgi:hypothetical protein
MDRLINTRIRLAFNTKSPRRVEKRVYRSLHLYLGFELEKSNNQSNNETTKFNPRTQIISSLSVSPNRGFGHTKQPVRDA